MDRISAALLKEFAASFGISGEQEAHQFEQFSAYLATRKHYSDSIFTPADIITGAGSDTGIDAIAIIVNNSLVTDPSEIDDLIETNNYLDVIFIFVQAETSSSFDTQKLGNFGYGVEKFFGDNNMPKNDQIKDALAIMGKIYSNSGKFTKGNPAAFLYYVTTGKWIDDQHLVDRAKSITDSLMSFGLLSIVEFRPVGAELIQKLYNQTKNKINREFDFDRRNVVSGISGVAEAHLGYMAATDFLKLVCDDQDQLIQSLFYENVRGWHGYNLINSEIKETLESAGKDRFVLMNNGVTIIAKEMRVTGDHFTIGDFQVVNGCQTSHVLYDNRHLLDASVRIPLRIISTTNDEVMEGIITATNRQTEVKQEQFFALRTFSKKLEAYFKTFGEDRALYYERRAHQYDSGSIEKTKIIGHQNLVRAVGAMILQEPHRTTRSYRLLAEEVGKSIFNDNDKLEPYYVAAYALYKLEFLFRNRRLPSAYKPARYLILLAACLSVDPQPLKPLNSNDVGRRALKIAEAFWADGDNILTKAAAVVERVTGGNFDRDSVRTERMTEAVLAEFGKVRPGPKADKADMENGPSMKILNVPEA